MQRWDEVEQWLVEEAAFDLGDGADMARPCLVAYRGEEPLFVAFLRPFEKGEYHEPLIELVALAAPLDADRLAFSVTARAWSLDDPVPPVGPAGDLRQRILMLEFVDASAGAARSRSVMIPFDDPIPGEPIAWGERLELPTGHGWIPEALQLAVGEDMRARLAAPDEAIVEQAVRVDRLGHLLALGPGVHRRLVAAAQSLSVQGWRRSRPHRWRAGARGGS